MVKYCLSPRKILRAEPEGFSKGLVYISTYILNRFLILILAISKSDTSCNILHLWSHAFQPAFTVVFNPNISKNAHGS